MKQWQGKSIIFAVAMAVLVGMTSAAWAVKIAVVDTAKVAKEYEKTKDTQTRLKKDLEDKENELKGLKDELEKMRTKLETQKGILAEKEYQKLQDKYTAKLEDFKAKFQESQTALMNKQRSAMEGIVSDIRRIVEEIAKAEKYELVLDKETVLYQDGDDITYKVLDRLNKKK
jgi:outer membrane protein